MASCQCRWGNKSDEAKKKRMKALAGKVVFITLFKHRQTRSLLRQALRKELRLYINTLPSGNECLAKDPTSLLMTLNIYLYVKKVDYLVNFDESAKSSSALSTIISAMAKEAVAAGVGALRTLRTDPPMTFRSTIKSCAGSPPFYITSIKKC